MFNEWNFDLGRMKSEVRLSWIRNWIQAFGVGREIVLGSIICWMLVSSSAMGGDLVIDSFQYATSAEAQAVWTPITSGSQPVIPVTEDEVTCLSMPCAFTSATQRGCWDKTMSLDLSSYYVISVTAKTTRPSMLMSLYFQTTGGGWYVTHFYVFNDWGTYTFPLGFFGTTGTISGWNNVTKIRLSFWQESNSSPATAYVSDLRAFSIVEGNLLQNSGFETVTAESLPDYWGPSLSFGASDATWVTDMASWRVRWGVDETVNHTPNGMNSLYIVSTYPNPPTDLKAVANYVQVPVGRTSMLSVWVRSNVALLPVQIQVYGVVPSASTVFNTSVTPNTWTRGSLSFTPTSCSQYVSCMINPMGNGTLWIDDVQLEDGSTATTWQPSSTDADMITETVHKTVPSISDFTITAGGSNVTVSIDSNCRFLVDGQPFIPRAYASESLITSTSILEHVAKAGFNTVVPGLLSSYTTSEILTFLNNAQTNGLKVIMWASNSVPIATLQTWIDSLKNHPAIIMWYVYDEPINDAQWENANAKYDLAKAQDTSRPAMINVTSHQVDEDWDSDVLSMDLYPVRETNSFSSFGSKIETMTEVAVAAGKPTWSWMQNAGYACFIPREPTGAEVECMGYMALVHGSRGLMYFINKPRSQEQWDELRLLNDEINTLTPVFSSTSDAPTVSADSPSIHLLSKSYDGNLYVIAVNESSSSVTTELTSSQIDSVSATVPFEDRNVSVVDGTITDTFAGYQRHVYTYTDSLAVHWKFDETTGQVSTDSSSNDISGSLLNGPTWTTNGMVGGALSFDGTDDYVVADDVGVNITSGGCNTVIFWMYWNGGNLQMPFGWNGLYDLFFAYGSFGVNTGNSGDILGISSTGLSGQWKHVVVVFPNGIPSPSNTKIYIDGVQQTVTQRSSFPVSRTATQKIFISGWGGSTGYKFGGYVDDVRIYNRELTADEVLQLQ